MIKTIICDDRKEWLDRASEILKSFADQNGMDMDVAVCSSPDEIPGCFGAAPDVLFMDIEFEMPGEEDASGIDAVRSINVTYPDCKVVYLTSYIGYALDVYQTEHMWFVTKDQFEQRLPEIFDKLARIDADSKAELIIKETGGTRTKVSCRDIRYLERRGRTTVIVTGEGEYAVHDRIPEIEGKLPAYFARCHASFIVNMAMVSSIGDRSLRLDDGTEILISRGYGRPFRLRYMEWAGSRTVK